MMLFCGVVILFLLSKFSVVHCRDSCSGLYGSSIGEDVIMPQKYQCIESLQYLSHLGTKTPYRLVWNLDDRTPNYKGCKPVKMVGVVRHGTRTPGINDAQRIRLKMGKIQEDAFQTKCTDTKVDKCLSQKEKDELLKWKLSLEDENGKTLTQEGQNEMFLLGQRFSKRFMNFLDPVFSLTNYFRIRDGHIPFLKALQACSGGGYVSSGAFSAMQLSKNTPAPGFLCKYARKLYEAIIFKYTNTQRAEQSAFSFINGLLGKEEAKKVEFPEPALDKDPILRFYKLCERWKTDVKNSNASKFELEAYKNSTTALAMTERVSARLGLKYTLSYNDVNLMYLTCGFEVAWHPNTSSPWCSVFSLEDFRVLEYGEDLKYYWRDGYGFKVNYDQACVLSQNIFDFFSSTDPKKEAMFYFTHSGTLLKLLSHLGLYKDSYVLKHDTSQQLILQRQWRVSKIDAFGTNVAFVLYKCSNIDDLQVLTLHQEKVVVIGDCTNDLCSLGKLRHLLGADETCSFSDICKNHDDYHNRSHIQGDL